MLKRISSLFVLTFCIFLPVAGQGFVPQAPHLIYLMIEKIRQPVGLEAHQTKNVLSYEDQGKGIRQVNETLTYSFPGRLRIQNVSEETAGFTIESESGFVKVKDSQVIAVEKSLVDLYTDILLYRDHESLLAHLAHAGIDTANVSFQRYNDTICFVLGAPDAGLWIDKESLFPLKYVVRKNGWTVEFFYENWQRVSRTWYPMSGSIFLDNQLVATINVDYFELKAIKSDSLFDVEYAKSMYQKPNIDESHQESSEVKELDRSIDNFKKLYE